MQLSACLIMKNEEKTIQRLLNSLKPHIDEIICVDTGSTDQTIDIVKSAGLPVHHFKWCNDFSAARNYSISLASGTWILWIDCDEELIVPEGDQLRHIINQNKNLKLGRLMVHNITSDETEASYNYKLPQYRLFKNDGSLKFVNAIHEHLDFSALETLDGISFDCTWQIKHDGYKEEVVLEKNKGQRNMQLIKAQLEKGDTNPWLLYHLASEYYRLKDFEPAMHNINLAIRQFLEQQKLPPSLIYKMKYDILINVGSFESIIEAIPLVLKMYPDYPDLHFYRGVAYYATEQFTEAIDSFEQCIALGEGQQNYLILEGVSSYRSYQYIVKCYEKIGDKTQVLNYTMLYEKSKNASYC